MEGAAAAHCSLAAAADLHRGGSKHGGHIQILLEVGIRAGLVGHAVAPLDEHMARCRDRRDADRLACTDAVGQCGLAVVIAGAQGTAADIDIQAKEILRLRSMLNKIIATHTKQSLKKIERDTERDFFLSADEAKAYGLVDHVVESKRK